MNPIYDRIGDGYATRRRTDPRLAARLRARLGDATTVLNVGAGAGSYEPDDVPVVALEPSLTMIAQRRPRGVVVQGRAEALPFADDAFDAVMGVLTVHHWADRRRGLDECARVARRRVTLLTWDPASAGFWLMEDYFPALLAQDRACFPPLDELRAALGELTLDVLPIPADCVDGLLGSAWRRPAAYLDASVRASMSVFACADGLEPGLERLRADLESGAWERRHGHLLALDALDLGYRLVTAQVG